MKLIAAFEIVTPKYGKRMYQSTSHEDMKVSRVDDLVLDLV